ncbi:26 kDa periplasmic immunogenic protein precursor [Stieleria maiorica]|uniref:26 kDa periplasmic immunogenic protein n=1 Tax=Stieleria maiorica TaxID=2795974 RepID=A0A5B9M7L4_9BACT|nr:SIMPL domain-containing protein [Stieleria maiorica]QEF96136.1 26 kDa periplasmic immunogenic protein precursor [Stieleria maiorica]
MNTRLITCATFTAGLMLFPVWTVAQEPAAESGGRNRVIIVNGTGEVSGVPDVAEINIGIVVEEDSAKAAVQANNFQMTRLLDFIKAQGISEKDIQTSSFSVSPRYQRSRNPDGEPPKIDGYRVSNQVHVRVRQIERLGEVLDQVVSAGANQINGISFSISKTETLMDEARNKAIRDAQRKAALMAKEAGVTLGRIVEIRDHSGGGQPQPVRMMAMAEARSAVPIQTGEQSLSAGVQLTFSLK